MFACDAQVFFNTFASIWYVDRGFLMRGKTDLPSRAKILKKEEVK